MINRFVAILILSIAVHLSACAQDEHYNACNKINEKQEATSIDAMFEQADFIALFEVEKFVNKETDKNQRYSYYELSLSKQLFGNPPQSYDVPVQFETKRVPPRYFYVKEIHETAVRDNVTILGFSYPWRIEKDNCTITTDLILGYEYLIFGGVNSRMAYQPILDRHFDPLYKDIKIRLHNKKK